MEEWPQGKWLMPGIGPVLSSCEPLSPANIWPHEDTQIQKDPDIQHRKDKCAKNCTEPCLISKPSKC